jgi:hypothetical protein
VLVILLDNLGFGATKSFGGVIEMPTLERLAKEGLIYNNFHDRAVVFAQPRGAAYRPQSAQRQHGIRCGGSHCVSGPNRGTSE